MDAPSPPFYSDELRRALIEQVFGIEGFTIIQARTFAHASAEVTLLEGRTITISLSYSGFYQDDNSANVQIFETVDELLQSVSHLYTKRRQDVLVSKLEAIASE